MAKRQLTDNERLEMVMGLLDKRALEQYQEQCEKLEETPPPFEAGICPDCDNNYHEGEMEYVDTSEDNAIIHHFTCPGCGNTVKEHFELVGISMES